MNEERDPIAKEVAMSIADDIAWPLLRELSLRVAEDSTQRFGEDNGAAYLFGLAMALARALVVAAKATNLDEEALKGLIEATWREETSKRVH